MDVVEMNARRDALPSDPTVLRELAKLRHRDVEFRGRSPLGQPAGLEEVGPLAEAPQSSPPQVGSSSSTGMRSSSNCRLRSRSIPSSDRESCNSSPSPHASARAITHASKSRWSASPIAVASTARLELARRVVGCVDLSGWSADRRRWPVRRAIVDRADHDGGGRPRRLVTRELPDRCVLLHQLGSIVER